MISDQARADHGALSVQNYAKKILRRMKGDDKWRAFTWCGIECEQWRQEFAGYRTQKAVLEKLVTEKLRSRGGLSYEQFAMLDLFQVRARPSMKWVAYELETSPSQQDDLFGLPAAMLSKKLNESLDQYFIQHTYVLPAKGCIWIRICTFADDVAARNYDYTDLAYVACFGRCKYIFTSQMKQATVPFVTHAIRLCSGADVKTIKECALSTKSLDALMDLTANKSGFGVLAAYKAQQVDTHPLEASDRKRKADGELDDAEDDSDEEASIAIDHSTATHTKFRDTARRHFGEAGMQPKLADFACDVETEFSGSDAIKEMMDSDALVSMSVKMKGSNVFEGLRELVEMGVIQAPLPKFFDVTSFTSNTVLLTGDPADFQMELNKKSALSKFPVLRIPQEDDDAVTDEPMEDAAA